MVYGVRFTSVPVRSYPCHREHHSFSRQVFSVGFNQTKFLFILPVSLPSSFPLFLPSFLQQTFILIFFSMPGMGQRSDNTKIDKRVRNCSWDSTIVDSSVQLLSRVWLFCDPTDCSTQGFPVIAISWSLLKLVSIELVMTSNCLILCCSLLLPSIFPSIRVFSNGSVLCIRWPKCWSFNFSISPSNEYSGLISLRIDWFDLLAVQGTLKSFFQHHSSKASVLQCCFLYSPTLTSYMTNGKTIVLTRWIVVKVMSLLFSMLSRLFIAFLPRSKRLLISWLQSPSAVTLEPRKIVCHYFECFPLYLPWSDGTRCHDLGFLNVEF